MSGREVATEANQKLRLIEPYSYGESRSESLPADRDQRQAIVAIYCPPADIQKIQDVIKRYQINAVINPSSLKILRIESVSHYSSSALDKSAKRLMIDALEYGRRIEPLVDYVERVYGITEIELLHEAYFLHQKAFSILSSKHDAKVKRLFDICVSLTALPLLSPLFLLTALAIKLESKGPVFYKQARPEAGAGFTHRQSFQLPARNIKETPRGSFSSTLQHLTLKICCPGARCCLIGWSL